MYDPYLTLNTFLDEVATVAAIPGTSTSKRFDATLTAWRELENIAATDPTPTRTRIGEAVIKGNAKALPDLVQEWRIVHAGQPHELTYDLASDVTATLRRYYIEDSGKQNHEAIATAFNKTADKLTKHANTVDLNGQSDALLTATDERRTAWIEAPLLVSELNHLTPALLTAVRLAGRSLAVAGVSAEDEALAATTNATGLHRRRVWEAWNNTEHRAKKWGALIELGATVHANPLDKLAPYGPPAPMESKQERTSIGVRVFEVDPEDQLVPQPA